MFRIARIRIKWINADQHDSSVVSTTQSAQTADRTLIRRLWTFNPRNWRVRVKWVGFGSTGSMLPTAPATTQMVESIPVSPPIRVLRTFDMPKMRVRVSWMGLGSVNRIGTWGLVLFAVLLGIFAFMRLTDQNGTNRTLDAEKVVPPGLIADEISLGNETIRMTHSPLDMGQSKDVFDNNIDTLMRGLNANPFIVDFEFSQPQAIKGLMMDFGRMDFVVRVQVYGTDSTKPISYQGEYRQQPPIPHMDMNFADGPEQVRRIYIEIEQLNPPEAVHIHVREVMFKK